MSTPIKDGGPAFPQGSPGMCQEGQDVGETQGMSLRDWFAGREIITADDAGNWELLEAIAGPRPSGSWITNPIDWLQWDGKWRAATKYSRADAMLAARKGGAQ